MSVSEGGASLSARQSRLDDIRGRPTDYEKVIADLPGWTRRDRRRERGILPFEIPEGSMTARQQRLDHRKQGMEAAEAEVDMMMREQGLFDEAPSLSVIQGGDRGPLADIADAMAEGKEGLVGWAKGAARSINLGDETFDDMARKLAKATRDELSFADYSSILKLIRDNLH